MIFVDSHCHLDALNYRDLHKDIQDVVEKAQQRSVEHCLAVSTTLPGFKELQSLTKEITAVSLSCGIHPLNLDEGGDISELQQLAAHPKVIALGETGLDFYYQQDNKVAQQRNFCEHIQVGKNLKKPVIVHTRQAKKETLALLISEKAEECGGVLHCFTEDISMARSLLDLGFYISFSGIVTFKNANELREVARYVPLDRLLVETDSPYLAPVPFRGKENQPAYVRDIAEYLALMRGLPLNEFAAITTDNFSRLFKISIT